MLVSNPTSGLLFSAMMVRDRSGRYSVRGRCSESRYSSSSSTCSSSHSWWVDSKRLGGSKPAPRPFGAGASDRFMARAPVPPPTRFAGDRLGVILYIRTRLWSSGDHRDLRRRGPDRDGQERAAEEE